MYKNLINILLLHFLWGLNNIQVMSQEISAKSFIVVLDNQKILKSYLATGDTYNIYNSSEVAEFIKVEIILPYIYIYNQSNINIVVLECIVIKLK